MTDDTILPFWFPAVRGKKLTAGFDGGRLSSDGGVMLLAQAARRMRIAEKLAAVIPDPRDPTGHAPRRPCRRCRARPSRGVWRSSRSRGRQPPAGELEGGVGAQAVEIVGVFVAAGDGEDAREHVADVETERVASMRAATRR